VCFVLHLILFEDGEDDKQDNNSVKPRKKGKPSSGNEVCFGFCFVLIFAPF